MTSEVVVEPMTEEFLLWRCLHSGPVSKESIAQYPADNPLDWERYRKRNLPLLAKLTQVYGCCAIVARDVDAIVGMLRFYPKAVSKMDGAGDLCLQQDWSAGPKDNFAERDFPPLERIEDKTLSVHCLMAGSPQQKQNPYQRKGIGLRMCRAMIEWARGRGWRAIEAMSFEDLPIVYEITGGAGHTFWEKLGFTLAERRPFPYMQEFPDFVRTLEEQAKNLDIDPQRATEQLVMRRLIR
ncbi:MAG: GNAT family N-acetyltransferase [Phycisphaerae bacterium]|nr:GNAT family N-acetyltransferase [Phycisphaerae bacterium]